VGTVDGTAQLLPLADAAKRAGLPLRTAQAWARSGWIQTAPGPGRARLVDPKQLARVVASRLNGGRLPGRSALEGALDALAAALCSRVRDELAPLIEAERAEARRLHAEAIETVRSTAAALANADAERRELAAERQRLEVEEGRLAEAVRRHRVAADAFIAKRSELSRTIFEASRARRPKHG
jgi:hypothetical protein